MEKSIFRKNWGGEHGYTMKEATDKKWKVDDAHRPGDPDSAWAYSEIVPDPTKVDGYMVVVHPKNKH